MDLGAAERMAAMADPKAVTALQKQSSDPAVAKAVAEQFGTMLLQRVMQNGDGSPLAMAGGVGGTIVNAMFASTVAQTAMSGDKLGLADLLFRSMEAKQQAETPGSNAAAASRQSAGEPSAAAPTGSGLPLSPYWQGHGMRPLGGGPVHAALGAHGGPAAGIALPPRIAGATALPSTAVASGSSAAPEPAPAAAGGAAAGSDAPPADGASPAKIESFSARLAPLLQQAAGQLGVSPRVLLAQAALETGWGRSVVGNNVFGVKTGRSWSGAQIPTRTHETENGQSVAQTAFFRAYADLGAAVEDFVSLVARGGRYRAALGMGEDAKGYGEALIAAGYATDGDYPTKLAAIAASPSVAAAFAPAGSPPGPSFPSAGT